MDRANRLLGGDRSGNSFLEQNQFHFLFPLVSREGLEPPTFCLRGSYSSPIELPAQNLAPGVGVEPTCELALRLINSQVPYQLGDPGIDNLRCLVNPVGNDPTTFRLRAGCSAN